MGKKKAAGNNDMTAILNQLQKTYSVEGEDDIFESETAYEDTELSDLLAKILSENDVIDDSLDNEEELDLSEDNSSRSKRKQKKSQKAGGSDVSTDIQNIIMSEEYISVLRDCEADLDNGDEGSDQSELQNADEKSTEERQPEIEITPSQKYEEEIETQPEQISTEGSNSYEIQQTIVEVPAIDESVVDFDDADNQESATDNYENDIDETLTFGDLDEEEDVDDNLTFGDLGDEEEDVDNNLTFGDLGDEEKDVDDSLTFGDLDEEKDVDDSLTFGDLDEEKDVDDSLTFGDLDNEEEDVDDSLTFGDLDDEEEDVDDSLTFGDIKDEESEMDVDVPFADTDKNVEDVIAADIECIAEDDVSEIPCVPAEPDLAADQLKTQSPDEAHIEKQEETEPETEKKFYYTVLEEMSLEDETNNSDEYTVPKEQKIEEIEECQESPQASIMPQEEVYIVLSRDSYTDDPLQWHLGRVQTKLTDSTEDYDTQETQKKSAEIGDDDISLLLQLGYKDEIASEVGQERTESVVHSIINSYRPDKNKIPFGFVGKEFCDGSQIDKIKQRYDYDKRAIIIKLALFSCVSVVLLILGLLFKNYTTVNSVIMFSVMELMIMSLGSVVMHKELLLGIKGVFKFSPTVFTVPVLSLFVLTAFDIFNIIIGIVNPDDITVSTTSLFGFTTSVFFMFALVVKLINCIREQKTFNIISASEELYTAESLVSQQGDKSGTNNLRSHEIRKQIKGNAVIVKKTRYISEYFKRCSESSYGIRNIMLIFGVVTLAAVMLACIIVAMGRTASDVASTVVFAFYMCLSASLVLTMPMMLFAASQSLVKKKCAIIGTGAISEYADINCVIFPDTAAFKINKDIEVVPFGDSDINASMKTANRLFSALGGTMSEIVGKNPFNKDLSVSEADINIASVDENGVELYMDGDTHILLGNEKFIYERRRQLGFDACDFISSVANAGREIVYLAINGSVCLGYIMSLGVNAEFTDKVKLLAKNRIKTYVSTYEPHIKARRYNDCKIGVYRPYDYDSPSKPSSRYGGIVASGDAKNITYPLIMTSEILETVRKTSKVSILFMLAGIVISFAVTLVGYLAPNALGLLRHRDVFTFIIQLIGAIPLAVSAIKLWKKYK